MRLFRFANVKLQLIRNAVDEQFLRDFIKPARGS